MEFYDPFWIKWKHTQNIRMICNWKDPHYSTVVKLKNNWFSCELKALDASLSHSRSHITKDQRHGNCTGWLMCWFHCGNLFTLRICSLFMNDNDRSLSQSVNKIKQHRVVSRRRRQKNHQLKMAATIMALSLSNIRLNINNNRKWLMNRNR